MLQIENLSCGYDSSILDANDLTVHPGQIVVLIGRNGSGKSTLLKTLGGVLSPLSGSVRYSPLRGSKRPLYLPAEISSYPGLKVHDALELISGKTVSKRHPVIQRFEIQELIQKRLELLSSGEKKRVFLTASLFHSTRALIWDEPFAFLDWHHCLELCGILKEESLEGRSFVIASHDLAWLKNLSTATTWLIFNHKIQVLGLVEMALQSPTLADAMKINLSHL